MQEGVSEPEDQHVNHKYSSRLIQGKETLPVYVLSG